jgi:predicted metal-dependent phosphoesterase TrpH
MMDLHMHTTASDGRLSPSELLAEAKVRGVSRLAITDHDTIDGYLMAREEARSFDIQIIPGIEWNTEGPEDELHILGYGEWISEIVERCNQLGMAITTQECLERAKGGVIVRNRSVLSPSLGTGSEKASFDSLGRQRFSWF